MYYIIENLMAVYTVKDLHGVPTSPKESVKKKTI